jgi:hypothetical protein
MGREFFDPPAEQQVIVLVDAARVRVAERLIESCEGCNAEAEIPSTTSWTALPAQIPAGRITFWKRRRNAHTANAQ